MPHRGLGDGGKIQSYHVRDQKDQRTNEAQFRREQVRMAFCLSRHDHLAVRRRKTAANACCKTWDDAVHKIRFLLLFVTNVGGALRQAQHDPGQHEHQECQALAKRLFLSHEDVNHDCRKDDLGLIQQVEEDRVHVLVRHLDANVLKRRRPPVSSALEGIFV